MVLIESHVISFNTLEIIKVLNIRKREKEGDRASFSWLFSNSSYFSDYRHHRDDSVLILFLRITMVHDYDSFDYEDHHEYDSSDSC